MFTGGGKERHGKKLRIFGKTKTDAETCLLDGPRKAKTTKGTKKEEIKKEDS